MKPSVFLSHSSRDQIVLSALKHTLQERTGNAVQFFLSSDGQSIPLGRNWVHRIEQALNDTAMMLVFISPASVASQWIYFEAGYAYSKGVRVVPIAFAGFDLANLTPPLSLLQGFNLRGADGLNNVIALVNQQFALTFRENFTTDDYASIFGAAALTPAGAMTYVDDISLTIQGDPPRLLAEVARTLAEEGVDHKASASDVQTFGATFGSGRIRTYPPSIAIRVDPALFEVVRAAIDAALAARAGNAQLHLNFSPQVAMVDEPHKVSALLHGSGLRIVGASSFALGANTFRLTTRTSDNGTSDDECAVVEFSLASNTVGALPFEVAEMLWRRGVLRIL